MRIRVLFIASSLTLLAGITLAQAPVSLSHRDFLSYTHRLYEEGNRCYVETGNKTHLKHLIDDYQKALEQRVEQGLLSQETTDSLQQEINKLLGDFHYLNSDDDPQSYDLAEDYFLQCLDYADDPAHRTHQTVNHDRFILYRELGQLYYKQHRYDEAFDWIDRAVVMASNYYSPFDDVVLDILSQWAICKARVAQGPSDFREAIEVIDDVVDYYKDTLSGAYGEALRKKAKILMLQQERNGNPPSSAALRCYKSYFSLKKREALKRFGNMTADDREHYWMRLRPFVIDCYRLEHADPAFLYDVTLFSKSLLLEYSKNNKLQVSNWQQIQRQLKPGECAIEFVQYEKYDKTQMGALVLGKQGTPEFVNIGDIDHILDVPLRGGGIVADAIDFDDPWLKDDFYSDSVLFPLIWTPELLNAIGADAKKVYFAPDGIFHYMAIEYMLPSEGTSLNSSQLYRLTSTRQLIAKVPTQPAKKVLALGGVDFDKASAKNKASSSKLRNDESAYYFLKAFQVQLAALPGTKSEIEAIRSQYDSINVVLLTDTLATEDELIKTASLFPIVHLATHGYFIGTMPEGTDLKPADYDESLSQNGLILAGANEAIASDDFDPSGHDGILSAREVSRMDLSNIRLIVLSACQTGEGIITGDGVYGLQRGLKNAGVSAMVVSLWSVNDEATSLLMQSFYKHLKTEDVHTAFHHARQELIETGRETTRRFDSKHMKMVESGPSFDLPEFYNAFILIDVI